MLQILTGLFVEFEHKWVRMSIIYVIGVCSGSLLHSVVNPCKPLCGASGGIYALMGASIMKIKRHNKYKGNPRRQCNSILALFIFVMTIFDLGSALYSYFSCSPAVSNTAISAHVGK